MTLPSAALARALSERDTERLMRCACMDQLHLALAKNAEHEAMKAMLHEWARRNLAMTVLLVTQMAAVLDERAMFARCANQLMGDSDEQ